MAHTQITTVAGVAELAGGLFDSDRRQPWVVVSTLFGQTSTALDVNHVVEQVGDVARVFTIETGEMTRALSELLPERLQVYGGAGRSYPVGFSMNTSPSESRLRFPHDNPSRATEQLVADALAQAHAAGLFERPPAHSQQITGVASGFTADGMRAMVKLEDNGGLATIWQELTYPPVPLTWALNKDQFVEGVLDLDTRRLNVELHIPSESEIEQQFPHSCVTLALVKRADTHEAVLSLHPQVSHGVPRTLITSNPHDRVDSLLTEGDVVAVRVVHKGGGGIYLRLDDVQDDDPVVAPLALTKNGPPWLREGRHLNTGSDPADTVLPPLDDAQDLEPEAGEHQITIAKPDLAERPDAGIRPMPGPGPRPVIPALMEPPATAHPAAAGEPAGTALRDTQLALDEARARIRALQRRIAEAGASDSQIARLKEQTTTSRLQAREALAELGEAQLTITVLRDEQRDLRRELLQARRSRDKGPTSSAFDDRKERWADHDSWVRHEIYLAWVDRVDPGERGRWTLPERYDVGERFANSLDDLDDAQLTKAFKAVTDVLTGRARELHGRAVHALRTGVGGDDPDLVRDDGARAFRVRVETNAPAARRLHYWQHPDGTIELSRIVTHDDMQP